MNHDLRHLSNEVLAQELPRHAADERASTCTVLTFIAEFDARHLYLPAGYPSMFAYCVEFLRFSEDDAYKKIHVARTARAFPALWTALSEGRMHVTAVRMLASHLTQSNVDELIAAATHKKKTELEEVLAARFPLAEPLRLDEGIGALPITQVVAPQARNAVGQAPEPVQTETPPIATAIKPIASQRYSLQVTLDGPTHDKLRRAQDLLSHVVPSRDVAEVIDRALSALIEELEKRKFAKTAKPRSARPSERPRNIPAHVKRAAYQRDAGRCAYVAKDGKRCGATKFLEFDHVEPVAHGGRATVDNIRLVCRAHNQFAAEQTLGRDFMKAKRDG